MSVAGLVLGKVAPIALKEAGKALLARINDVATSRLNEATEISRRDFAAKRFREMQDVIARFEAYSGVLARVAEQVDTDEFRALQANLEYEAMRSVLPERRDMLACASGALLRPDWPIEKKARVERTLRDLDPQDVRVLYAVHRAVGKVLPNGQSLYSVEHVRGHLLDHSASGDVLRRTGCTKDGGGAWGAGPNACVTALGIAILDTLRIFLRRVGPAFPVPGRQPELTDEQTAAAWVEINASSALRALLDAPLRAGWYHWEPGGRLASDSGETWEGPRIDFVISEADASTLRLPAAEAMFKFQVSPPVEAEGSPQVTVHVFTGDQTALRAIADRLDLTWLPNLRRAALNARERRQRPVRDAGVAHAPAPAPTTSQRVTAVR